MKLFGKILIVIGLIVAVLLITALFTRKEYTVEREITINKPKQSVFDFVKYIDNQRYYNKWVKMDPNAKRETKGADGTVGFVCAWESTNENVGKGEQEIMNVVDGERVDLDLRFVEPFEGKADASMTTTAAADDKTNVKWTFHGGMSYPMNIMLVFMDMEGMLGKDLEEGLADLKSTLEK